MGGAPPILNSKLVEEGSMCSVEHIGQLGVFIGGTLWIHASAGGFTSKCWFKLQTAATGTGREKLVLVLTYVENRRVN